MTNSLVHRSSGDPDKVRKLGPYEIESLIEPAEELNTTAYRVRIAPHQTTRVSYHQIAEELYFVIAGQGRAILNGQDRPLRAGELLRLPPGTTHGFITDAEALEMLNIHTPGCRPGHDVYFADGPAPEGFMTAEPG